MSCIHSTFVIKCHKNFSSWMYQDCIFINLVEAASCGTICRRYLQLGLNNSICIVYFHDVKHLVRILSQHYETCDSSFANTQSNNICDLCVALEVFEPIYFIIECEIIPKGTCSTCLSFFHHVFEYPCSLR